MCWSAAASVAMVGVGGAAAILTWHQGRPRAIWLTLGYFTVMEGLQATGYAVLDQCGSPANRTLTMLSYLHIVFQPFFLNAFAMELVPGPVRARLRGWVFGICALSAVVMLLQVAPLAGAGSCTPGSVLCGPDWCLRSGTWHIAWDVPYNGLLVPLERALGTGLGFPSYVIAFFGLPLLYGAWRLVLFQVLAGPVAAWAMTSDPGEMPAIWCLFSIVLLLVSLNARLFRWASQDSWYGRALTP